MESSQKGEKERDRRDEDVLSPDWIRDDYIYIDTRLAYYILPENDTQPTAE
jgi:hypothetical protein